MNGTIKNVKTERWSKCAILDIPTPKDVRLVYHNTYGWAFYTSCTAENWYLQIV